MKFKPIYPLFILLFLFTLVSNDSVAQTKPQVQLAILLDTSNSMDGLIDQAKSQLWKIVNELALTKRNGQSIDFHVGLYEYGKSSIAAEEGHLRQICALTTDLDKISEELFALTTNGGDEYCGQVIGAAVRGLKWSEDNDDLKIIFIAGNEPFTQGKVDYKTSCKEAIGRSIIVNTIFCGNYQEGIDTFWKDGADLADGKYINIDQNQQIVRIDAPQDSEIVVLGQQLNETYIAYGSVGKEYKERQNAQDMNAMALSPQVMAQRSVAKASAHYKNQQWDLVDAEKTGAVSVESLDEEALPEEMKEMDKQERKAYLEDMSQKRRKIQKHINRLNKERRQFIADQLKNSSENTLDTAMLNMIREQAKEKNYTFEDQSQ
ncbi:VWA domain-containing protein [candidate division KSB1 bacterium]|nr:VWA domain-containing protein [candidate division KSB1 bacterium]